MPTAVIDGLTTRYQLVGSGPPLLMYAPAGFDATLEKWTTQGVYARTAMMQQLSNTYTCVVFDRRECGQSGGRLERVTWAHYAAQGLGLLNHLGIEQAHVMGGCMGCGPAAALAVAEPQRVRSMVLYWPVGGARYRLGNHQRFATHIGFVKAQGLAGVVNLVGRDGKAFGADPRVGPWASVIKQDAAFTERFMAQDVDSYLHLVAAMARTLFDRDTAPGAEPEDLMRLEIPALIVPGRDAAHATSAARYLEECLPRADYWDIAPADQTEANVPARLLGFLAETGG